MKQKSVKKIVLVIGLILFVLFVGLFSLVNAGKIALAKESEPGHIVKNVSIGGIDVSGMTKEEADEAIASLVTDRADEEITLVAGEKELTVTPAEVGFAIANDDVTESALLYGNTGNLLQRYRDHKDIEAGKTKDFDLAYTVDASKIESILNEHLTELETKAVNHGLTRENGQFNFVEGKDGLSVNVQESVAEIKKFFENDFVQDGGSRVALATEVTEPIGSAEDLKSIKDVLGSYSTNVGSFSSGRGANVLNGASQINGTVLYPGETISVGDTMGPYTRDNGYTEAGAYENGVVVQSMGGGICQVSTTLYNAVIRAELEVVERYNHSMIVGYVKPSEDAAIAEGVKDFKFKNNLDTPVYLEMYGAGGVIYANVFGKETRPANRQVSFVSETLETIQPTTIIRGDSSMAFGAVSRVGDAPHTGYSARLWKVVTVDGVEQSREVFNTSKYRATNVTYAVGTKTDNPEAASAIGAAIASNNLNNVRAAAAEWSAAAAEKPEEQQTEETAVAASPDTQTTQTTQATQQPQDTQTTTQQPVQQTPVVETPVTETPQTTETPAPAPAAETAPAGA